MIHIISKRLNDKNCLFAVVSRGRAYNVKNLLQVIGKFPLTLYLYVPENEVEEYQDCCDGFDSGAKVIGVKYSTLSEKRNIVLGNARDHDKHCIIMDDDLVSIKFAENKTTARPISFNDMISYLYDSLFNQFVGYKAVGIPQIAKLFYFNPRQEYSIHNFVVSNIYLIKKECNIWFDERFKTKSDYDFSLQNIIKYGGILRCNRVLAEFKHWSNKGGLTGIRNPSIDLESIKLLKEKWSGDVIRDNPRRKGEILIKI